MKSRENFIIGYLQEIETLLLTLTIVKNSKKFKEVMNEIKLKEERYKMEKTKIKEMKRLAKEIMNEGCNKGKKRKVRENSKSFSKIRDRILDNELKIATDEAHPNLKQKVQKIKKMRMITDPEKFKTAWKRLTGGNDFDMPRELMYLENKSETNDKNVSIKERFALLSKTIFETNEILNIGQRVTDLTEKISDTILSESDGDWFDKHTLKRNASEITKKGHEFSKNASELKSIFERMQALYEEIGMLIERYM